MLQGIVITGLSSYVEKHGQFTTEVLCLQPHSTLFLCFLFFLFETFVFGASTHLGRYVNVI